MRNLHLNELIAREFHPELKDSEVKKIIRQQNYTVVLACDNVYLLKNNELIKLNCFSAIDFEWLQVRNIIFIWSKIKFEWYDVYEEKSQIINLPGSFQNCSWNSTQDKLALIYNTGRVETIEFDFIENIWILTGTNNIEREGNEGINITGTAISWNKQCDSFVVTYHKDIDVVLNIYSENCVLLYQGDCSNVVLLPSLSWHPDGSIIAVLENKNGYTIQLFECNGLKNSYLRLHYIRGEVKNIKFEWNNLGDILAVTCTTAIESTLALYSHRNFKWDLKQHLIFNNNVEVKSFTWLSSLKSHITFQLVTSLMEITYSFNWSMDTFDWLEQKIESVQVAIIDEQVLRISNITNELIPPPLSGQYVVYTRPINFLKFSPKGMYKVVVYDDNMAVISRYDHSLVYEILLTEITPNEGIPLSFNNFYLDNEASLFFLKSSFTRTSVYKITKPGFNQLHILDNVKLLFEIEINATYMNVHMSEVIIRTYQNVRLYQMETKTFKEIVPYIPPGEIRTVRTENSYHIFSLSEKDFIMDEKLLFNDITSYLICHNYIMLTTTEAKLLCYRLNLTDLDKLKSGKTNDIFTRNVARDSVLIAGIPGSNDIILEIARGDIEIIKPRALSIQLVAESLENKRYQEAFHIAKNNRLDMNVLIDLNCHKFVKNVHEFISSFKDCQELNIFITSISDENIVLKLYKSCVPDYKQIKELSTKKTVVLNKVIEAMKKISHSFYLQSIIIANMMFQTKDSMEEVMWELLWGIRESEKDDKYPIDDIFFNIVPMTTEEDLLKAALAIQEFTLVQWIASRTQLDPLDYVPFFLNLSHMEPNYKSYAINNFLKRYHLAYESLIKCDGIEVELTEILDQTEIFNVAVQKTPPDNQWYSKVMMECGLQLFYKEKGTESGLLFKKIKEYKYAFKSFIKDGNFDEFMKLVDIVKNTKDKSMLNEHFKMMAKRLEENEPKKAAVVLELMKKYEEAIILLIAKKEWTEAMRYILKYNRIDFIETNFYSAIIEYTKELCRVFEQKKIDYNNKVCRLEKLRSEKVSVLMMRRMRMQIPDDAPVDYKEHEHVCNADISSVMSVLSVTTQQTGVSTASTATKNKKKLARKVQEAREGSVFENIALMRQLHLLITEIHCYSKNVHSTCINLLELDKSALDEAMNLHSIYCELVETIEKSSIRIWPDAFITPPKPLDVHAAVLQLNIEHLEPKYRCPPPPLAPDWKISILKPFVI